MSFNNQQLKNINGDTMILYIPRVHKKHSSRDIRIKFISLGLGENLTIDVANNPSTGFNMVFVFFDMKQEIPNNLKILKICLSKGQDIRVFPVPSSKEFWMILPSNADHELEETEQIKSENLKAKIQLDYCFRPVNRLKIEDAFRSGLPHPYLQTGLHDRTRTSCAPKLTRSQNRHFTPEEEKNCRDTYAERLGNEQYAASSLHL